MRGKRQADAVLSLMGGEAFISELDTYRRLFYAMITAVQDVLDAGNEFLAKLKEKENGNISENRISV